MSWTRSLSAFDILASSGMAVIRGFDGEVAVDAGGGVDVGVAVGVKAGTGVEAGVDVGVAVGVKVGAGVDVGVGVAVGVKVGAGAGVGVGTGLPDRPQLSVRNPIRRRENARRRLLRFRNIGKHPFKMRFHKPLRVSETPKSCLIERVYRQSVPVFRYFEIV